MTSVSISASRSVQLQRRAHDGPGLLLIIGPCLLTLVLGVGYAWARTELVHTAMETGELRRLERELEMRERELLTEVSALKNPARIEKFARTQLGLVTRSPSQLLQVNPEIMRKVFAGRSGP